MCRQLSLPWKFLRSLRVTHLLNSKYANHAASGKVVTVYPRDAEELRAALTELDAGLGGRPSSYILSGPRWNKGPVSVWLGRSSAAPPRRAELGSGSDHEESSRSVGGRPRWRSWYRPWPRR